ncbi:Ditrans,polycis-undecaprenyl-diphosphate synthase ((2E,6E)-farnesyl-diphosphate specific) [bacterium HR36]|nr:Ditrans,polycis-undecaprenyl-diphosphate synthase ((2E,6E)-farnesyl-diphosphate specific) [bacterium HR36]
MPKAEVNWTELGLSREKLPRHVAIIMDGNGRWARRQGLPRIEGHRRGVQSIRTVVEESCRLGLQQLTLYCLSVDNWKRPRAELEFLMLLLEQYLREERQEILEQNIRFTAIGRLQALPAKVRKELEVNREVSRHNTGLVLCLALNYGARAEITDAVRELARQVRDGTLDPDAITEDTITNSLYTAGMPDPDLLIRTSGEMRLSNFLLWQISYAELHISPKCWPEFTREDYYAALRDYAQRQRRFGGLPCS